MKIKKKGMSIRRGPSLRLKVKPAQRVTIIAGFSALMFSLGIFLYVNFNNVEKTRAASIDRICTAASPVNDLAVKSIIQLPLERQPGSYKQPTIINKRKAVILPGQN